MRLSICIPTYNRAAFIGETLRSILDQANGDIEICISDNASSDNTKEVIERVCSGYPKLVYFRWDRNMGADRNFLKVIDIASGEYCWFMGSDDIVEPGAISHILSQLQSVGSLTGLSVNRHAYSPDMTQRLWERPVAGGALPADRLFTDVNTAFSVLGDYFGYLPGQIVNRSMWTAVVDEDDLSPYYNAYVHVYVIARMLQRAPNWLYVSRRCAGWRSGNDSFMAEGMYKRLSIDVLGYQKIAADVFGVHSAPYRSLMRTVATVHVFYAVLNAKLKGASASFFIRAAKLCVGAYWRYPGFWMKTVPLILVPQSILRAVRVAYRSTLKRTRINAISTR